MKRRIYRKQMEPTNIIFEVITVVMITGTNNGNDRIGIMKNIPIKFKIKFRDFVKKTPLQLNVLYT